MMRMRTRPSPPAARQRAFSILEVLVALLIFSFGTLGVAGLYATSARVGTGAEFRTTAALLAQDLIGRMWMSDRTAATLQANFSSAGAGAAYASWRAQVERSGLPVSARLAPTVSFSTVDGGGGSPMATSLATITIYWQGPGDETAHQYVALAQMKP